MNWPTIHGAVYNHRAQCMKVVEQRLMKALDDPATTRKQLKQEMHELLTSLAESGP